MAEKQQPLLKKLTMAAPREPVVIAQENVKKAIGAPARSTVLTIVSQQNSDISVGMEVSSVQPIKTKDDVAMGGQGASVSELKGSISKGKTLVAEAKGNVSQEKMVVAEPNGSISKEKSVVTKLEKANALSAEINDSKMEVNKPPEDLNKKVLNKTMRKSKKVFMISASKMSVDVNPNAKDLETQKERERRILAKAKEDYENSKWRAVQGQSARKSPEETVCVFFMSGKCQKGKLCRFSHVKPDDWKQPICKQFSAWFNCRWGKRCMYIHENQPPDRVKVPVFAPIGWKEEESSEEEVVEKGLGKSLRKNICFAFQKGECHRGAACWFMHLYTGVVQGTKGNTVSVKRQAPMQQRQRPVRGQLHPARRQMQQSSRTQPYPATQQMQLQAGVQSYGKVQYQQVAVQPAATQVQAIPVAAQTVAALPVGWAMQYDSNHKTNYYYNIYTGESQWEVPTTPASATVQATNKPQAAINGQPVAVPQPTSMTAQDRRLS